MIKDGWTLIIIGFMIQKTTVNGYKLQRVHPRLGELERWAVDRDRLHYGYIIKAVYKGHIEETRVIFWFCSVYRVIGWRKFTISRVSNTRRDIVREIARIIEGKKGIIKCVNSVMNLK